MVWRDATGEQLAPGRGGDVDDGDARLGGGGVGVDCATLNIDLPDALGEVGRAAADAEIAVRLFADRARVARGLDDRIGRLRERRRAGAKQRGEQKRRFASWSSKDPRILLDQVLHVLLQPDDHFLTDVDVERDLDRLVRRAELNTSGKRHHQRDQDHRARI